MTLLSEVNQNPVFEAEPSPTLVLDPNFVIRAANKAYLAATGRTMDDLLGVNIFEAFPDNPEDPEADGVRNLNASLERVLRARRPHDMVVQRYDVLDPADGRWVRKYWAPVNSPIQGDGEVLGIVHRVQDITPLQQKLDRMVERYSAIANGAPPTDRQAAEFVDAASSFAASAKDYHRLVEEVTNLRRALVSRSTIDQAKGIVMAEQHCSAEAAFALIKQLSHQTNVRVADVAAALVYQAQRSR